MRRFFSDTISNHAEGALCLYSEAQAEIDKKDSVIVALGNKCTQFEDDRDYNAELCKEKDKEIDRLKSLLSLTPEDIKTSTPATAIHLNHENNALRVEIARLKAEIEAFEAMKKGLQAEIAELRTELAEAKNKQVLDQKQCDDMTAEAARMAAEIADLTEKLRLSGLRGDSLDRVVEEGVQKEITLDKEIAELKAEIKTLHSVILAHSKMCRGYYFTDEDAWGEYVRFLKEAGI